MPWWRCLRVLENVTTTYMARRRLERQVDVETCTVKDIQSEFYDVVVDGWNYEAGLVGSLVRSGLVTFQWLDGDSPARQGHCFFH